MAAVTLHSAQVDPFTSQVEDDTVTGTHALQNASGTDRIVFLAILASANNTPEPTFTTVQYDSTTVDGGPYAPTGTVFTDTASSVRRITVYYWLDADLPATADTFTYTATVSQGSSGPHNLAMIWEVSNANQVAPSAGTAATAFSTAQQTYTANDGIQFGVSYAFTGGSSFSSNDSTLSNIAVGSGRLMTVYATDGTVDITHGADYSGEYWRGWNVQSADIPTLTTVDGDASPAAINVGQTSIAVVGTALDTGAETAKLTEASVGDVPQTGYAASDGENATFDLTRGNLPTDTAGRTVEFHALNTDGQSAAFTVEISVESGWSDVLVAEPITTSDSILSLLPESTIPANGDVIEWETNSGAVTIAANGVITCTTLPQTFDWRFWDESENALSSTGTVTLNRPTPVLSIGASLTANQLRAGAVYSTALQAAPSAALVLATGHYETPRAYEVTNGIMPIAPRHYSEYTVAGGLPTSSDTVKTLYTHWCSDTTWRVPIGAINGAFPYIYSLVGAPTGMIVEQTYTPNNWDEYGWIKWPAASITTGTHEFTLVITDQTGASVAVGMALNITDTNVLRIDADVVGGSADGTTWANAYADISDVYGTVASRDEKIIALRGAFSCPTGGLTTTLNTEPRVWVGDPDVTHPTITMSGTDGPLSSGVSGNLSDRVAFVHLKVDGSNDGAANPKQIVIWDNAHRSTVADIRSINPSMAGTTNDDNNDGIVSRGAGSGGIHNVYQLFKNIGFISGTLEVGPPSGNGSAIKFMDVDDSLMEDVWLDSAVTIGTMSGFCYDKHDGDDKTFRLIRAANVPVNVIAPQFDAPCNRHVWEYCNISSDGAGVNKITAVGDTDGVYTDLVYRRVTFWGDGDAAFTQSSLGSGTADVYVSNSIGVVSAGNALPLVNINGWTVTENGNLHETTRGAISDGLDASGNLGTGDANYGKKGWEIA